MSDERNFSKRENDETGYVQSWISSYERALANRSEDGGAGPRMSIADVLNGDRFALAAQPGPTEMLTPRGGQFDDQIGAQPRPEGSGVVYDADLGNTWAGSAGREARNQRASEEGDQPSYYKNGA